MNLILRDRENWLDNYFRPFWSDENFSNYSVPINLKEDKDSYIVQADLPGLEEKDIKVEFDNGVLIVSGERKFENKEDKENYHRREISYGKFSRSFRFGDEVKDSDIKAKFNKGVLEISLPKKEAKKPKLIPLH